MSVKKPVIDLGYRKRTDRSKRPLSLGGLITFFRAA